MRKGRIVVRQATTGEVRIGIQERAPQMVARGGAKRALSSIATNPQETREDKPRNGAVSGFGGLPPPVSFTKLGKRKVKECAAAIEHSVGKQNCRFLTGTLPGSTVESLEYIARYSGWIVKNIEQWVRDEVPGAHFVVVWEYQKRGALHLHVLLGHTAPQALWRVARRWRKRWLSLLETISKRSGVDLFARRSGGTWRNNTRWVRADCQRVRLSVARYLAKYLSKAACKLTTSAAFSPSRWWGVSANTRKLTASLTNVAVSALLSLNDCSNLFAVLSSELCCAAAASFTFSNPMQPWCRTVIAFIDYEQSKLEYQSVAAVCELSHIAPECVVGYI